MKKIVIIIMILFLTACGSSNTNKYLEENYIEKNSYEVVYNDLSKISYNLQYIPTKETEKSFIDMIEAIKVKHDKFSSDELSKLYSLINIDYDFKYNKYTNDDFQKDLTLIESYIAG